MTLRCLFTRLLLGSGLLVATVGRGQAQVVVPDSTHRPAPLLLKAGLRLTHLHYTYTNRAWQFRLPLLLGAEYRLAPHISLYTQLEADLQTNTTRTRRRRNNQASALAAATLGLGGRYYYGRPRPAGPEFGDYLALEGNVDWSQVAAPYAQGSNRRNAPTALVPALYGFWGTQHRLRPHFLYDLSAGLGILAPAYYSFERVPAANHWNVAAQVNIRLFFGN